MKKVLIIIALIFLSSIFSVYKNLFIQYWWIDIVQHLLGGFFVAMLFSIYLKDHLFPDKKMHSMLILVGVTVFIGVMWEFLEYIANRTLIDFIYQHFHYRTYFMGDLQDTVKDLMNDILGSMAFALLHLFGRRNAHKAKTDTENNSNAVT